jgi:Family of unknown function (DUF6541)
MSAVLLYLRLAGATAVVLAPGWLLARALGVRGVAAALAWSLTLLFGSLAVTFLLQATLTTTLVLLALAAAVALVLVFLRPAPASPRIPGIAWVYATGIVLGILLWRVAKDVDGDGFFHLARARKMLELDDLSLDRFSEFVDGSLHPGYAFPLWHGLLALVAKISGTDPAEVVVHLPSILAVLALVVAYEAGWALFRRTWAAGAATAAQAAIVCFAPGHGGSYTLLSLPATSSRQLLVPAALALALESLRRPSLPLLASTAAAGFVLAVVHPTYAIFLWLPFVGFLVVRVLWTRGDVRAGAAALAALAVPAALFLAWLLPVVNDTVSVSPDADEVRRAFEQYSGQLDVRSETSYSLTAEVFTRTGAVAVAAILLFPLAAFAARRRWAAYVAGGSLAVLAVMLVPLLFTSLADLVSISQARRAAGFLPFAFAFAGGLGVLSRLLGPFLPALALVGGVVFQVVFRGDFDYTLDEGAPSWIVWVAVAVGVAGLVVGLVRRGPPLEENAGLAATLFLLPVVAFGLARWTPVEASGTQLSPGLVEALRTQVPAGAVVYSDPETSYRVAALAPVYIAVAPPGHVADTAENRPYARARDARRFIATADLSIPESYGADYLVVDRGRQPDPIELQRLYGDSGFTLYRLPAGG